MPNHCYTKSKSNPTWWFECHTSVVPFFLGSFHLSAFAINIQLTPIGPFPHQQVTYTRAAPLSTQFPGHSSFLLLRLHYSMWIHAISTINFKFITAPSPSQAITSPAALTHPLLLSIEVSSAKLRCHFLLFLSVLWITENVWVFGCQVSRSFTSTTPSQSQVQLQQALCASAIPFQSFFCPCCPYNSPSIVPFFFCVCTIVYESTPFLRSTSS